MLVPILSSASTNTVPNKKDYKQSSIIVNNPNFIKIIFALLVECDFLKNRFRKYALNNCSLTFINDREIRA